MVKAKWIDNKLVVEAVSKEEEQKLAPYVADTLALGLIAVYERVAYANNETEAREKLE